jgi:hypothetical protein
MRRRRVGVLAIDRAPVRISQRLAETTMSNPHLPTEILDHVVAHLYDMRDALKSCCLVSKSWIPRVQKHLFTDVMFYTIKSLQTWKEMFPDPSISPGCYVKLLFVGNSEVVTVADAEAGGWITGPSRVVRLVVSSVHDESKTPFIPFHGFSPVIKSLSVFTPTLLPSPILSFILSFPLLEDLSVIRSGDAPIDDGDDSDRLLTTARPLNPPTFTVTLELRLGRGMQHFIHRLLFLPGGIHFRELTLTWIHERDHLLTMVLVEGCSHTLRSLEISYKLHGTSIRHLHPHRYLIFVSRRNGRDRFDRPLKSNEAQRCGLST